MKTLNRYARFSATLAGGIAIGHGAAGMRLSGIELWGLAVLLILAAVAIEEICRGGEA